jgi:hypothetical protein
MPPAGWIKLTHNVGNVQKDVYINAAQICLVGDSAPGEGPQGSPTHLILANREIFVLQSVAAVLQLITQSMIAPSSAPTA